MTERPTIESGRQPAFSPIVWGMQDATAVTKLLGKRVRSLREKRNWSQEGLAHQSGLARSFTGAIERGEKDLGITTLVKLAIPSRSRSANLHVKGVTRASTER